VCVRGGLMLERSADWGEWCGACGLRREGHLTAKNAKNAERERKRESRLDTGAGWQAAGRVPQGHPIPVMVSPFFAFSAFSAVNPSDRSEGRGWLLTCEPLRGVRNVGSRRDDERRVRARGLQRGGRFGKGAMGRTRGVVGRVSRRGVGSRGRCGGVCSRRFSVVPSEGVSLPWLGRRVPPSDRAGSGL
jgi:hypothetical protein